MLKNLAGLVLLVMGVIMAMPMVPGPGLLFILVGVSLLDVPHKRALELRVLRSPVVLAPLNAIRARWKQPPLQVPVGQGAAVLLPLQQQHNSLEVDAAVGSDGRPVFGGTPPLQRFVNFPVQRLV